MHQRRHGLFHLYVSVISCTRGATGYFTFMLVLYHAPEAPRVIPGGVYCYPRVLMMMRLHLAVTDCLNLSLQGVSFSVTFTGEEEGRGKETEVLIPLCKCNSHKKAIDGELTVKKVGLYTLIFDNRISR